MWIPLVGRVRTAISASGLASVSATLSWLAQILSCAILNTSTNRLMCLHVTICSQISNQIRLKIKMIMSSILKQQKYMIPLIKRQPLLPHLISLFKEMDMPTKTIIWKTAQHSMEYGLMVRSLVDSQLAIVLVLIIEVLSKCNYPTCGLEQKAWSKALFI